MTNELKQAYTRRIAQANKTELVVILYELYLYYANEAKESLNTSQRTELKECLRRARGCVNELMESLRLEQELGQNLLQLYLYVYRELIKCEADKDVVHIINTIKVMEPLKEAYENIRNQDTSEAVMSNAQTVVAGLTYGRKDLTDSMNDQGISRGFYV